MTRIRRFVLSTITLIACLFLFSPYVSAASYKKGFITWNPVPGAVSYNIYFKEQGKMTFCHAVGNLPATSTSYTITYLQYGVHYQYTIAAVDASGNQFWWSGTKWIWNVQ